jgi:hypothetical protein
MRLSRPSRLIAAIIAIVSLLFVQLAVASYVCPELDAAVEATVPSDNAQIDHCVTAVQPSLCHAHCEPDSQSSHTTHVPPIQAFVASELTVVICDTRVVALARTPDWQAGTLQRSTAPPLAIRNCCFRI